MLTSVSDRQLKPVYLLVKLLASGWRVSLVSSIKFELINFTTFQVNIVLDA